MSDAKRTFFLLPEGESPYTTLTFESNGQKVSLKVTLDFDGPWAAMFEGEHDEETARNGFAGELFAALADMF